MCDRRLAATARRSFQCNPRWSLCFSACGGCCCCCPGCCRRCCFAYINIFPICCCGRTAYPELTVMRVAVAAVVLCILMYVPAAAVCEQLTQLTQNLLTRTAYPKFTVMWVPVSQQLTQRFFARVAVAGLLLAKQLTQNLRRCGMHL